MNRRAALQALVGIPAVTRLARLEPKAREVLIVACDERLPDLRSEYMLRVMQDVFPGRKFVFDKGSMRLKAAAARADA